MGRPRGESSGCVVAGRGESKTSPRRIAAKERAKRALELRQAGATYEEIAEALGYEDRSGPYRAVKKALDELPREAAVELRRLEAMRLDRLQRAIWVRALGTAGGDNPSPPDLRAVDRVLEIQKRRANLFGLDAPKRTEVTGAEGGPIEIEEAKSVLEDRLKRLHERRRKKKA